MSLLRTMGRGGRWRWWAAALAAMGCADGEYDPCEGKEAGDECWLCPPDDPDCFETLQVKVCDEDGVCTGGAVS